MPHRTVKIGTEFSNRPEAYALSASSARFTLKAPTGPRSLVPKGPGPMINYSIGNIKNDLNSSPIVIGNYDKDYEIVQTHGRSLNNRYSNKIWKF